MYTQRSKYTLSFLERKRKKPLDPAPKGIYIHTLLLTHLILPTPAPAATGKKREDPLPGVWWGRGCCTRGLAGLLFS